MNGNISNTPVKNGKDWWLIIDRCIAVLLIFYLAYGSKDIYQGIGTGLVWGGLYWVCTKIIKRAKYRIIVFITTFLILLGWSIIRNYQQTKSYELSNCLNNVQNSYDSSVKQIGAYSYDSNYINALSLLEQRRSNASSECYTRYGR